MSEMTWMAGTLARRCALVSFVCGLAIACGPVRGCPSSSFRLADESRLPAWFSIPDGMRRADVTVTMSYYGPLFGSERSATLVMTDRGGRKLEEVVVRKRGSEPTTLRPYSGEGAIPYPMYEILSANGITEIVEHRQQEPFFYVSDSQEIRQRLLESPVK